MNRAELVAAFRARVSDQVLPYLWSEDEVQEYLDDAHNEAVERSNGIRDSATASICTIAVTADVADYALSPRILSVERAKLDNRNIPLDLTSTAEMDRGTSVRVRDWRSSYPGSLSQNQTGAGWEQQAGQPKYLVLEFDNALWRAKLSPIPTENDTLRLHVFRLPLALLDDDDLEPEIAYRLHIRLVDWMEHRAYSKKDAETYDEAKAARAAAAFTSAFGERIDANVRRQQLDRSPATTVFREF